MGSVPTTAAQICHRYGIEPAVFMVSSAMERMLFRAAYAADVLKVREYAAYNPANGECIEGPPYNNVGPDVNRYLIAAGAEPGEPWCASFGTCMLLDSGVPRDQLPDLAASVHGWLEWAEAKRLVVGSPVRGFAGLIIESPTTGHFAVVASISGHLVNTIEGNTNEGGSRDGMGVFRRSRPIEEFHCFVDLSKLTS